MSTPDQTPDTDELERAAEQIEAPLAGLVGDYEESEADNAPQAKGIFLLPNLLTSGALFCGFYAIIAGMQGDFYAGAVAILVAMLFALASHRPARRPTSGMPSRRRRRCRSSASSASSVHHGPT